MPTALKKPAAAKGGAKLAAKSPAKPALAKGAAKAAKAPAVKAEKAKAAPKPIKPFEAGEIVEFKGYAGDTPADALFKPGDRLAVVGQREENGQTFIALTHEAQYFAYQSDPDNVEGEEVTPAELKRTGKMVEQPYHLPAVGNMGTLLTSEDGDPLAIAQKLYSNMTESFFYLGGMFNKLFKERDEDGKRLFQHYGEYEDSNTGFEAFINDNFAGAEAVGGVRKIRYFMSIYENFSTLPNAAEVVKELTKVGWWKAALMAKYVTEENATELVQVAQSQNSKEFEATLKTSYVTEAGTNARGGATSRATIKRTVITVKLFEDQAEGVNHILAAAQKQLGMSDLNHTFEHIVTEWAADHLGEVAEKAKGKVEAARKKLLKGGVKLPADHPAAVAAVAAE
jgi:hypothetical protein